MAELSLKIENKEYGKSYIDDFSCTTQISTDASSVNYCVIPAIGNATMRDVDEEIRKEIDAGNLDYANARTKAVLNGKQLGSFVTDDSEYDIQDKAIKISFGDSLSVLDNVKYKGMALSSRSQTIFQMLDDVVGELETQYVRGCTYSWFVINTLRTAHRNQFNTFIIDKTLDSTNGGIYTPVKVVKDKPTIIRIKIARSGINQSTLSDSNKSYPVVEVWSGQPTISTIINTVMCYRYIKGENDWNTDENPENYLTEYTLRFTPKSSTVYLAIRARNVAVNRYTGLVANDKNVAFYVSPKIEVFTEGDDGYYHHQYSLAERLENEYCVDGSSKTNLYNKLMGMTVQYPYLKSGYMREVLEQFCTITQTTMALDEKGQLRLYDARPVYKDENVISIPKAYQKTDLEKTLFLKNKASRVSISQQKPKIETNNNGDFYTFDVTAERIVDGSGGYNYTIFVDGKQVDSTITRYTYDLTLESGSVVGHTIFDIANIKLSDIELWNYEEARETQAIQGKYSFDAYGEITTSDVYMSNGNYVFTNEKTLNDGSWTSWVGEVESEIENIDRIDNASDVNNIKYGQAYSRMVDDDNNPTLVDVREAIDIKRVSADFVVDLPIYHEYYYYFEKDGEIKQHREVYEPNTIEVTVKGTTRTFSSKTVDKSRSLDYVTNGIEIDMQSNLLMQDASIVESIRDNVLDDYEDGVATANIELFCGVKDNYASGDIIKPNDIVKFSDDDGLWRVTSRTLNYQAVPTMSLELQRQRQIGWQQKNIMTIDPVVVDISDGNYDKEEVAFGRFDAPYRTTKRSVSALVSAVYYDGTVVTGRIPFGETITLNGYFTLYRWCELEVTFDKNGITYSAESLRYDKNYYWKSLTLEKIVEYY